MPLTYAAGQYRVDGEPITEAELTALRDQQIDLWADELGRLTIEELGITITRTIEDTAGQVTAFRPLSTVAIEFPLGRVERFAARFLTRVGEIVTSAYVFAAGGVEAVTEQGWRTVAELVGRQEAFGRGFVDALRAGDLSEAQAVARSRLYAGSAVESFERGVAARHGWEEDPDQSCMPGSGCTQCGGQCRCALSYDESPEGTELLVYWRTYDQEACPDCKRFASDWSPLRVPLEAT